MPLFHRGQRVGSGADADRWQVVRKIGEGQFAEVYEVRDMRMDGDARFAMKVEKRLDSRSVKQEYRIMKQLSEQCPQICPVLHGGQLQQDRWYMVMQLLCSHLVELRRGSPGGRLDPRALRQIAGGMLDALQAVHSAGFIHRDVKPANFSQVPSTATDGTGGEWRLLDFGLARRYTDDAGATLPARPCAAFRGSTTYASVHAHSGADLGRRDDLWSWLYCVVELAEGTLPWRQVDAGREVEAAGGGAGHDAHRSAAAAAKQAAITHPERLARVTPITGVVAAISAHLSSLGFSDTPDYGLLRRILATLPDAWPTGADGAGPPLPQQSLLQVHGAPSAAVIDLTAGAWCPPGAAAPHARGSGDGNGHALQPADAPAWGNGSNRGSGDGQQQQQQEVDPAQVLQGQHAAWSSWAAQPPAWCALPPEGSREAAAVTNMAGYLAWLRGGVAGATAERLAGELAALHPADGLAVVAAVLGSAVVTTPPATCNALAALLSDVAAYAGHAAQQAGARYLDWQQQQQQQQQGPGPGGEVWQAHQGVQEWAAHGTPLVDEWGQGTPAGSGQLPPHLQHEHGMMQS